MKLYGHFISLTTLQVLTLFAEKKASVELALVDVFAKEQKQAKHRSRHPFGHIPVLKDGAFSLYETHAILRYLDSRLPGLSFIPTDVMSRARMDQWLCIEQNYLLPAAKKVMARGYAEMMELPDPGEAVVAEGKGELAFAVDQFAQWIADKPYVAGESVSLADLCWVADLRKIAAMSFPISALEDSRIKVWRDRVSDREAVTRAEMTLASYPSEAAFFECAVSAQRNERSGVDRA